MQQASNLTANAHAWAWHSPEPQSRCASVGRPQPWACPGGGTASCSAPCQRCRRRSNAPPPSSCSARMLPTSWPCWLCQTKKEGLQYLRHVLLAAGLSLHGPVGAMGCCSMCTQPDQLGGHQAISNCHLTNATSIAIPPHHSPSCSTAQRDWGVRKLWGACAAAHVPTLSATSSSFSSSPNLPQSAGLGCAGCNASGSSPSPPAASSSAAVAAFAGFPVAAAAEERKLSVCWLTSTTAVMKLSVTKAMTPFERRG